jgi:hypothetical protein
MSISDYLTPEQIEKKVMKVARQAIADLQREYAATPWKEDFIKYEVVGKHIAIVAAVDLNFEGRKVGRYFQILHDGTFTVWEDGNVIDLKHCRTMVPHEVTQKAYNYFKHKQESLADYI